MKLNLGNNIKKYRKGKDMTQESLAEYLGVSPQAVSRWENGTTYPDMELIVAMANLFDVPLDDLFGRNRSEKENDITAYNQKSIEYMNQGDVQSNLSIWREAVQKYPGDFGCLSSLAYALLHTIYASGDNNSKYANAVECIAICERILRDSTDNNARTSAIQILVMLYSYKDFDFADEQKALNYAQLAGKLFCSREFLMEHVYFKEESAKKRQEIKQSNILQLLDHLTMGLYYGEYFSTNEKIQACVASLKLWETLIPDGNYLFYHCRIEKIYLNLAFCYAELGESENSISALEKALYHAKCFDKRPAIEQNFTSDFVNLVTSNPSTYMKNYAFSDQEDVQRMMKSSKFDFLRKDDRFIKLQSQQ